MMTIEPLHGLTNRMRVIASAVCLKEKSIEKFDVIWQETNELNCPYEKLFEPQDSFIVRRKKTADYLIGSYNQAKGIKKKLIKLINNVLGIDNCISYRDFVQFGSDDSLYISKMTSRYPNICIQTCEAFGDNYLGMKRFQPIANLKEKIDQVVNGFGVNTVGVHIRRTDHKLSISHSPTRLFVNALKKEMDLNPKTNFFLSTDDISIEKRFCREFGDKIIIYNKEFSRNTVSGIQDALVDLYCLSRTSKIFGSFWSSFSETAAQLGDIELITMYENRR